MSDCSLIRFFKMLKKLVILPKLGGGGGCNVPASAWDKNIPLSNHFARLYAAATVIGASNAVDRRGRRRPQEARSRGKERKPHRGRARRRIPKRRHWQGEPDRDQTQRRRGRLRAREGCSPRGSTPMGGSASRSAQRRPTTVRRCFRPRSPGLAAGRRGGRKELWRGRDRRDATAPVRRHSRISLPVAAGRSEERRFCLLRADARRRPVLLRRPLPNGLSVAARATDCVGATRAPSRREFMAAIVRAARENTRCTDAPPSRTRR
jgi:hypothetical protein